MKLKSKQNRSSDLPSREDILHFIHDNGGQANKREIARHFKLKGAARIPLKAMLKDLQKEGIISSDQRRFLTSSQLPAVAVLRIIALTGEGELRAAPVNWKDDQEPPQIFLPPGKSSDRLAPGDRVLSHLEGLEDGSYLARPIRKLPGRSSRLVGLYEKSKSGQGRLVPADKKVKAEFSVSERERGDAQSGDIVIAEIYGRQARVLDRIGSFGEAKTISLMAAAVHQLPLAFPPAAAELADRAKAVSLQERMDLRSLPLVTIDDEDARDFDDAVFAEERENGWRLVVAIADVAHYVKPGDALDQEALRRGNSVYFPDRVVPMLPEALSNGWCSLKPKEDRPCLAVEIFIDAQGNKKSHKFMRGLMRSAARLTYRETEATHRDNIASPLPINPLYGAYRALQEARKTRGTLDLDLPERRVYFGKDGHIERIVKRERFDSHRLIEEFMILANVCAAETLERNKAPCMYRVHDAPDPAKLEALRDFLQSLHLRLASSAQLTPRHFAQLLQKAADKPYADTLNQVILRSQSQAIYSPINIGHFGLALKRYAHFTSPIRRYADLLVHRSLIKALQLGEDGLTGNEDFQHLGDHISQTERQAVTAERDAMDRFVAVFLSEKTGQIFSGRISGVQRFGLFISLIDNGADGLLPISRLPGDFYQFDAALHALKGQRTKRIFKLGDPLQVMLRAADPLTGTLDFDLVDSLTQQKRPDRFKPKKSHRRRKQALR